MPLGLYIDVDITRPPEVMKRKWSDFTKAANQEVAETWENKYLPLHFESFAQSRYGLQKRRPSTIKKKQALAARNKALFGGLRALVESGLLAIQMTRRGILRVFPTRFTLSHPSHVPQRPKNSTIDLHAEVIKTIDSEVRFLTKVWKERILDELAKYKPRPKRQKR